MPDNNSTRHKSSVALILIDVINRFEFPDGDKILKNALPMADRLAKLKQRCRRAGIPAIYVNDNFGQWRSDAKSLVTSCLESRCAGRSFVEPLRPDDEDYFVLNPMHSAFFQTPLESAEVDILADGTLDYPNEVLKELDYTVCSVHSRFGFGQQEQTERILRAVCPGRASPSRPIAL